MARKRQHADYRAVRQRARRAVVAVRAAAQAAAPRREAWSLTPPGASAPSGIGERLAPRDPAPHRWSVVRTAVRTTWAASVSVQTLEEMRRSLVRSVEYQRRIGRDRRSVRARLTTCMEKYQIPLSGYLIVASGGQNWLTRALHAVQVVRAADRAHRAWCARLHVVCRRMRLAVAKQDAVRREFCRGLTDFEIRYLKGGLVESTPPLRAAPDTGVVVIPRPRDIWSQGSETVGRVDLTLAGAEVLRRVAVVEANARSEHQTTQYDAERSKYYAALHDESPSDPSLARLPNEG